MNMLTSLLIFAVGCGVVAHPCAFGELLRHLARWLVTTYNQLKARYCQWVIQREGAAEWNEVRKHASELAKVGGFTTEEVLLRLQTRKADLIELYGTRFVQECKPYLFEELEVNFDVWMS